MPKKETKRKKKTRSTKSKRTKRNVITAGGLAIVFPFEEIKLLQKGFFRIQKKNSVKVK